VLLGLKKTPNYAEKQSIRKGNFTYTKGKTFSQEQNIILPSAPNLYFSGRI